MVEIHARRRAALRAGLADAGLDALLVTDLPNLRYLSGFTGSNGALLVTGDDEHSVLCTDGRYLTQSAEQAPDLPRLVERACAPALAHRAAGRTGFDSAHVTVDGHAQLREAAPGLELVRAPGLVERLRMVKDDTEVAALRAACAAADTALAGLLGQGGLYPGRTEREIAADLEVRLRAAGAAGPSFETIVAAGPNSAVPHHRPTDAELRPGDLVKVDFGALVDGYHSDMTRTVVLGPAAAWQRELYDLVAAAQAAGRAALRVGSEVRAVDSAARDVIAAAGRGSEFPHGLGHGVGLEIHEAPALSQAGNGRIAAGMTVTVEPGVYLAGRGGIRIEDTLVVRPDGPELLTTTTKDFLVL